MGARVVAWRRMTGGVASVVHRLTIDRGGYREVLVLRQYEHGFLAHMGSETAALVRDEFATLHAVHDAGLPAPEPVAADPDGCRSGGHPAILMTRLAGRVDVTRPTRRAGCARSPRWPCGSMMRRSRRRRHFGAGSMRPPRWSPPSATRPAVWEAAFGILRQRAPEPATCFIHRDLQHFNLLWRRGRLTGVVDWATSCTGPADFDIGHCRLNLAVLFGADWAERLRLAYEAEAGRAVDPWWDLYAITAYSDAWRRVITAQVADRGPVDTAGMTSRVEDLLEATLGRL